jgi:FtsH-binding integral membrane protein
VAGTTDAVSVAPHSLTVATFGEKAGAVRRTQQEGFDMVRLGGYLVLGTVLAVVALTAYVFLWFSIDRTVLVAVHALLLVGRVSCGASCDRLTHIRSRPVVLSCSTRRVHGRADLV